LFTYQWLLIFLLGPRKPLTRSEKVSFGEGVKKLREVILLWLGEESAGLFKLEGLGISSYDERTLHKTHVPVSDTVSDTDTSWILSDKYLIRIEYFCNYKYIKKPDTPRTPS
jgi:hypothetical protein